MTFFLCKPKIRFDVKRLSCIRLGGGRKEDESHVSKRFDGGGGGNVAHHRHNGR